MTNVKRCLTVAAFLGVFFALANDSLAQINLETYAEIVERGNVEQKRDALLQIRNLENAEASRIAIPLLRDSSEIVRATAAFSVIYLPKDEAWRVLAPLLQNKSAFVRRETAYALGKIRHPAANSLLIQTFRKDKVLEVKNACVIALGEIGDVSAIDFLIEILRRNPQTKEEFTRRSAARSIGQIAQVIQTGRSKVTTPGNFDFEEFDATEKPTDSKIVETFPVFRAAIAVLVQTLQNSKESPDAKREAAYALGAIGDESATAILQANLGSEDYYLAEISRQSLRKISRRSNKNPE